IRPAIFSASLLAAAREVRASRTWTGLAGSGRMALIDHRDAAEAGLRGLTDPALWGAPHAPTGPALMSWPGALALPSPRPRGGGRAGRDREVPRGGRAALPRAPDRRRRAGWNGRAADHARVGDPRRRERPHDRHVPGDHRPPPTPGRRVPSRLPRGVRLTPGR